MTNKTYMVKWKYYNDSMSIGKISINQMDLQAHNFQTNSNGRPSGCIYHMILITKTLFLIVL